MGTRHIIKVVRNGKTWISQYGQWDGYPTGQGCAVLEFIRDKRYVEYLADEIDKGYIVPITEEQYNERMKRVMDLAKDDEMLDGMIEQMFVTSVFSRDAGAKCLKMFARPLLAKKYAVIVEPSGWEEYQYTLDLDKRMLRIEELCDTNPQSEEFPFESLEELNEDNAYMLMDALEKKWKEAHKGEEE